MFFTSTGGVITQTFIRPFWSLEQYIRFELTLSAWKADVLAANTNTAYYSVSLSSEFDEAPPTSAFLFPNAVRILSLTTGFEALTTSPLQGLLTQDDGLEHRSRFELLFSD